MPKRPYSSAFIQRAYGDYRKAASQPYKKRKRDFAYGSSSIRKRMGYDSVPRTRGVYAAGEMKYFDTERGSTAIPASTDWTATEFPPNIGTPNTLLAPTVGSAINERIGRAVNIHRLFIRGSVLAAAQVSQSAADSATQIRIALVQDMQTNASQAQGEEIFQAPTNASALNAVNTFQSLANLGRFKVHKDKTFILESPSIAFDGTNVAQSGLQKTFKMKVSFNPPLRITFNAVNGGTISDVVDNSFCIYANCSSTALTPTISYNCRVYYKE